MEKTSSYHVTTVSKGALNDFATGLCLALRELGYPAGYTPGVLDINSVNILLDAAVITDWSNIPGNTIIFNLEQLGSDSRLITPEYLHRLATHEVWDYSAQNIAWMRGKGLSNIKHVPIGYTSNLTRIQPVERRDIDIFFYGALSQRRINILSQFQARGRHVVISKGAYKEELDRLLARSKIILNIHCYESKIFEIIRCSHLLANRKAIVSEVDRDTDIDPYLRNAILGAPADQLVDACEYLLNNEAQRLSLENRGYDIFTSLPQTAFIPLPRLTPLAGNTPERQ